MIRPTAILSSTIDGGGIYTFLPLRGNWVIKVLSFFVCGYLADSIIYSDRSLLAPVIAADGFFIFFESGSFLEPLDISTIFGNALDNAIEASEKLPEDKRLITVKAECIRNMLLIMIENNVLPGTAATEGTTKTDRFIHGFGLPNIKNAAGKYGGQCSIKSEDGKFTLKIIVPIP